MPYVDDLPVSLQNILKKPSVPAFRVKCIINRWPMYPDSDLDISSDILADQSIVIRRNRNIYPFEEMGEITISEVRLKLRNTDDKYNMNNIDSPIYYFHSRLAKKYNANTNYIDVPKGDAKVKSGQYLVVDFPYQIKVWDMGAQASITYVLKPYREVDYIDTNISPYFDRIYLVGNLHTDDIPSGTKVETFGFAGKQVIISNYIPGDSNEIIQFHGIVKGYPEINEDGTATLIIQDYMKTFLDTPLKANDVYLTISENNNGKSTIKYTLDSSSDGRITLDSSNVDSTQCPIGDWEITFKDDGDTNKKEETRFTIKSPNGNTLNGDTGTDLSLDGLSIPASAWTGTFHEGDLITFKTVCTLGPPTNDFENIATMLKQLISADFGADYHALDTTFDEIAQYYAEISGRISFTEPTTVLKAIEVVQKHGLMQVLPKPDGTLTLTVYKPKRYQTPPTLDGYEEIISLKTYMMDKVHAFKVYFDYDYETGEYKKIFTYPEYLEEPENYIEMKFPAFKERHATLALITAQRLFAIWGKGIRVVEAELKYNYGAAIDLNEIYSFSSIYPYIKSAEVEIFEVEKDILQNKMRVKGYELHHTFNNYCFCDIGDRCDTGKVCF